MPQHNDTSPSAWPHRVAVALVCATFPLIWVGGLVTTYEAGMAVPDWPSTRGYNLFLYPWQTWIGGPWDLFIEHGHRLLGAFSGLLTIVLAVVAWRYDPRRWLRGLAVGALAAVIGQGLLGGARVLWNDVLFARIHACTGPLFLVLCVAIAVCTSKLWWAQASPMVHPRASTLHRLSALSLLLAFLQLVLGAHLRHVPATTDAQSFRLAVVFHVIMAVVLLLHVAWLALHVAFHHRQQLALRRPAWMLFALITIQVGLGLATWVVKYGWPSMLGTPAWAARMIVEAQGMMPSVIITAHVATGSLLLALLMLLTLRSQRLVRGPAVAVAAAWLMPGVNAS